MMIATTPSMTSWSLFWPPSRTGGTAALLTNGVGAGTARNLGVTVGQRAGVASRAVCAVCRSCQGVGAWHAADDSCPVPVRAFLAGGAHSAGVRTGIGVGPCCAVVFQRFPVHSIALCEVFSPFLSPFLSVELGGWGRGWWWGQKMGWVDGVGARIVKGSG